MAVPGSPERGVALRPVDERVRVFEAQVLGEEPGVDFAWERFGVQYGRILGVRLVEFLGPDDRARRDSQQFLRIAQVGGEVLDRGVELDRAARKAWCSDAGPIGVRDMGEIGSGVASDGSAACHGGVGPGAKKKVVTSLSGCRSRGLRRAAVLGARTPTTMAGCGRPWEVVVTDANGGAKLDHGSDGMVLPHRSKTLPVCQPFPVTERPSRP